MKRSGRVTPGSVLVRFIADFDTLSRGIALPRGQIEGGGINIMEKAKRRTTRRSQLLTLKREQAVYDANLSSWLLDHEGEYVLIKGKTVDGFYTSRDDALLAGYSRFGIGPLFVKQVLATEPVYNIPNALI